MIIKSTAAKCFDMLYLILSVKKLKYGNILYCVNCRFLKFLVIIVMMEEQEKSKVEYEKHRYFTGHSRKPLICCICDDFYQNPCLLSCYHSFCARCLENRMNNGVIFCPLCG